MKQLVKSEYVAIKGGTLASDKLWLSLKKRLVGKRFDKGIITEQILRSYLQSIDLLEDKSKDRAGADYESDDEDYESDDEDRAGAAEGGAAEGGGRKRARRK